MDNPVWLVLVGTFLVLIYFVNQAIYNIFFHPLRSYPGPKLWAASRLPLIRSSLAGHIVSDMKKIHEEYGDVVRTAPDELSYINAAAWKVIQGFRQGHEELPKDHMSLPLPPNKVYGILSANKVNHARFRRLLSHAFSDKGLREQEPRIRHYVDLLIRRLHEYAGQGPQNMVNWYNWTTFDLIGDLAFGEPFHCLDDARTHPWIAFIYQNVKSITVLNVLRRFRLAGLVSMLLPKKLQQARKGNYEYARDQATRRMALGKDRGDFIDKVLKHDDEKGMSLDELVSNSSTLVLAGSETTATLLSGATYYLLQNPHTMEKLVNEIRGSFTDETEFNLLNVGHLVYLGAVIEETLRIYPPVQAAIPRRVVAAGGDTILGKWVPPQTVVVVQHYVTYHAESNFHRPDDFVPERFLGDPDFASDKRDALQPFSVGPRNCIGRNLAYLEMRLILAKVLFNFDMELDRARSNDWADQLSFSTLWEKGPLWVSLKPVTKTQTVS